MKTLRTLLALLGAGAVLFGGAWAGGALTPSAQAAAGRPSRATDDLAYGQAGEIPIGDSLQVNGQPMQLSLFYTGDAPSAVLEFYATAFIERGLRPILTGDADNAHLSVFDPEDGMQRFISAVPQPDGQTMVMVGITDPGKPPSLLRGAKAASFPVPDEHRAFMGYRSEDASAKAETGQFVTSLTPAQTAAFYRERLTADGWTPQESGGAMTVYARGDFTLSVAVQALSDAEEKGKAGTAVFVNKLQGGVK